MNATPRRARRFARLGGLVAAVLLAGAVRAQDEPVDLFPRAAASYLVAVDGQVRWARAADTRRPVASLAKLLAALVVLEPGWQADAAVSVSAHAARVDGTRLGLRAGERGRAGELLGAMLVASSNDACLALAEHAAGSAAAFVARMNARAAALGLHDSHFEHPCGLDRTGQFSSAADLLRLAQAALAEPVLAQLATQERGELRTIGGRRLPYRSSNLLLGRLDGAGGLKTGTTSLAGHCLIATARRASRSVVVVLLDADDRWSTAAILIEEALRVAAHP